MNNGIRGFSNNNENRWLVRASASDWRTDVSFGLTNNFVRDSAFKLSGASTVRGGCIFANGISVTYFVLITRTTLDTGADLTLSRGTVSATSNLGYVLFAGGGTGNGTATTVADKYTIPSNTIVAQTSANLSVACTCGCTGTSNDNLSLIMGNAASNYVVIDGADKCLWATFVTSSHPSAKLTFPRCTTGATNDNMLAVHFGGSFRTDWYQAPGYPTYTLADRVDWSTLTAAAQPSANLTIPRHVPSALNDGTNIVVTGGHYNATGGVVVQNKYSEKVPLSTLTAIAWSPADLTSLPPLGNFMTPGADAVEAAWGGSSFSCITDWATLVTFASVGWGGGGWVGTSSR